MMIAGAYANKLESSFFSLYKLNGTCFVCKTFKLKIPFEKKIKLLIALFPIVLLFHDGNIDHSLTGLVSSGPVCL